MDSPGYKVNFNQDFTSISVFGGCAFFRIFSINACDRVEEIYAKDTEQILLVERLFNSSLIVLVYAAKPNCLQMLHFKKKQNICNCVYPSKILGVRMNRTRLIVCLAESIHIHDIRDMKILHAIENIAPNELGLCSLSLNSQLAFPICSTSGELCIFNAYKLKDGKTIKAHDTKLSALNFSPSGQLLATASERGTVIRVFCVKSGQRVQEFRRGIKRCVRIASLVFSVSGDFLCVTSNTETVHIFKIDEKAVMEAEVAFVELKAAKAAKATVTGKGDAAKQLEEKEVQMSNTDQPKTENDLAGASLSASSSGWSGYLSKAVSSYLIPSQVSDVLAQDRAFATAVLAQPGMRHICGLVHLQNDLKLLIASEEGFLYIHEFNAESGGVCKLLTVHDLRGVLDGVIELSLSESMDKMSPGSPANDAIVSTAPTINFAGSSKVADSSDAVDNTKTNSNTPETSSTNTTNEAKSKKSAAARCIIQNPEPTPDNSYAGILKGHQTPNALTAESAKFRKLCDAIDTPSKLYDERQFPPVAIAARD